MAWESVRKSISSIFSSLNKTSRSFTYSFATLAPFAVVVRQKGSYGQSRYRWHGTLGRNGSEFMGKIGRVHCAIIGFARIGFYVTLPLRYPSVRAHWSMRCTIKVALCQTLIVIVIRIHHVYSIRARFTVSKPANRIFKDPNNNAATIVTDSYSCHTIKCGARGHVAIITSAWCPGMKQTKFQHYQLGMLKRK